MTTIIIKLRLLKSLTQRLPLLEMLSDKILQDLPIDASGYQETNKKSVWLFERALFHLLNKQKTLQYQIEKLISENQSIGEQTLRHIQQNSNFQNTLTYEFKTSINHIDTGIRLLKTQYINTEQKDALGMISLGTDELNAKLNQIIQLTRIDKGQVGIKLESFNPARLIADIIELFQPSAREGNLLLLSKIYHADYVLEGDAHKITLILSSLIDNALKFTQNGAITVSSQLQHLKKSMRWTLQVEDTGIGIAPEQQERIFEPFFQVQPEMPHSPRADNLSLFLIRRLAELMRGNLSVKSEINKGSVFTLSLVLDDWQNYYERTAFKDKHIAVWYQDTEILVQAQRLLEAGATLQHFNDGELLLDYLLHQKVDLLIISHHLPIPKVTYLIKQIRFQESHHRVLILYYYDQQSAIQLNQLAIEGVDFLEPKQFEQRTTDDYIKKLLQYLN